MPSAPLSRQGRRWLAVAALGLAALSGCTRTNANDGAAAGTASAGASLVDPSAAAGAAAASPLASGATAATAPGTAPPPTSGLTTVTLRDGSSYVGRFATPVLFQPCAGATAIPFTSDDTVRDGGECDIADGDTIRPAVNAAVGGAALVTSLAVSADGSAAVAAYVKGPQSGQVLLTKKDGAWTAVQSTNGVALNDSNALSSSVAPTMLREMQGRLKFDIAAQVKVGTVPAAH